MLAKWGAYPRIDELASRLARPEKEKLMTIPILCLMHGRTMPCPYCEIESLKKELAECKALFKAESECKAYTWAEVMRLRKENMRLKESPMDCCDKCENFKQKEEQIRWSGEVVWIRYDGYAVPQGVTDHFQIGSIADRLIDKRTKITIEEI